MDPPSPSGRQDVRPLVTNAPPWWPSVVAPERPGENESVDAFISRLSRQVATRLGEAGLEVVDRNRKVLLGQQVVKVDLIARVGGDEVPVFVFPGLDPEREGAMFAFLRAALHETGAFPAEPLFYAARDLRFAARPTDETMLDHATRFLARAAQAGVPLSFESSPAEVVDALRALAPTPVESGGGDTVMEAACLVGEWLRHRAFARWVLRDDLPRSVLVVEDVERSTQWHLPVFAWFPDAVRTGYDGLASLLGSILAETSPEAREPAEDLPLSSRAYRAEGEEWLEETLPSLGPYEEAAALLRRCAACGEMTRAEVAFEEPAGSIDTAIARALAVAGAPRSPCAECGGVDYREMVLLYTLPVEATRAIIVTEVSDSHVRISTRELQRVPA